MKSCSVCKIEKDEICFSFNVVQKSGLCCQCKECDRLHYIKNRDKVKARQRKYYAKTKEARTQHMRDRYRQDPSYRLADLLRTRLRKALKQGFKTGSAVRDLGCTIQELRYKLEMRFYMRSDSTEMTWKNQGEWHLDHIEPLSSFDLTDRKQLLRACHYSNLQPLWAEDNLSKGARVVADAIPAVYLSWA